MLTQAVFEKELVAVIREEHPLLYIFKKYDMPPEFIRFYNIGFGHYEMRFILGEFVLDVIFTKVNLINDFITFRFRVYEKKFIGYRDRFNWFKYGASLFYDEEVIFHGIQIWGGKLLDLVHKHKYFLYAEGEFEDLRLFAFIAERLGLLSFCHLDCQNLIVRNKRDLFDSSNKSFFEIDDIFIEGNFKRERYLRTIPESFSFFVSMAIISHSELDILNCIWEEEKITLDYIRERLFKWGACKSFF